MRRAESRLKGMNRSSHDHGSSCPRDTHSTLVPDAERRVSAGLPAAPPATVSERNARCFSGRNGKIRLRPLAARHRAALASSATDRASSERTKRQVSSWIRAPTCAAIRSRIAAIRELAGRGLEIVDHVLRPARAGIAQRHRRVRQDPLQEKLRPAVAVELGGPRRHRLGAHALEESTLGERPVGEHGHAAGRGPAAGMRRSASRSPIE